MKYLFFIAISIMVASCTKPDLFTTYDIKVGETVNHSKDLKVVLDSIQDSRCPKFSFCTWPGEALVHFSVKIDEKAIDLMLRKPANREGIEEQVEGYRFKLLDVLPYPENETISTQEDFNIRLLVEKES